MKPSSRWSLFALALLCPPPAALANSGCSISSGARIDFGATVALASTGDVDSNSGGSLVLHCGTDVTLPPSLYSSSERSLVGAGGTLPFRLSLAAPGGLDLADAAPGSPVAVPSDDADHVVTLHARLRAADFAALPSGAYSGLVSLTLEY